MNLSFQPRRILIFEAYTNANIGSCALVENALRILKEKYPSARIKIMAHYRQAFRYEGVESVPDVFDYPYLKPRPVQALWLAKTLLWLALVYLQALLLKDKAFPFFRKKMRYFKWADLVVSVGAERINDKFVKSLVFSALSLKILKTMGKKVVFFPSTIGPFLYPLTRALSAHVLRRMDLIYTRDRQSTWTCLEELKLNPVRVIETADVAVIQPQEKAETATSLIRSFRAGKIPSAGIVGISALKWTYRAPKPGASHGNYEDYLYEMATLADTMVERYGVLIGFYPTNFPVNGCREDDVTVCREIRERMIHEDSAFVADKLTTPSQFKGMLSLSQVNIVTRMHACILSTGAGVPTLSINYLFKLREYMKSLGLERFSVDIEDFNAFDMLGKFDEMWKDRDFWAQQIRGAVSGKREMLQKAMARMPVFL